MKTSQKLNVIVDKKGLVKEIIDDSIRINRLSDGYGIVDLKNELDEITRLRIVFLNRKGLWEIIYENTKRASA